MRKMGIGIVVVLLVCLAWLLRFGFVPVRAMPYPIRASGFKNWEDVFKQPGRFILEPWQTGTILVKSRLVFLDPHSTRLREFNPGEPETPSWAYFLRHPAWGDLLIDTGFDRSFSGPRHGNYSLLGRWYTTFNGTRHVQAAGQSLNERLQQAHALPNRVFFTHLHFDHTAGLPALPDRIEAVFAKGEMDFVARVLNGHYFARLRRVEELNMEQGQPMPPFDKAVDLLGDGSLWAVRTNGHTPAHVSYVVMTVSGPALITGDSCFYYQALALGIGPFTQYPGGRDQANASLRRLQDFTHTYPQVRVFVGHDDLKNQPIHFQGEAHAE